MCVRVRARACACVCVTYVHTTLPQPSTLSWQQDHLDFFIVMATGRGAFGASRSGCRDVRVGVGKR